MATVDDYIRAFLQVVAYYQFLRGADGGDGPSKEELKLRTAQRRAQRTGDPGVLQKSLLQMPGAEVFCTRTPHFEGAEVFGSQKRKPNTPVGDDDETHRPDTMSYSRPRVGQRTTRAHASPLPTIIEDSSPTVVGIAPSSPSGLGIQRVKDVQETNVNERLWHIARLPVTSAKACWALHAGTKKKCTAKIVSNNRSTPAPCYTGFWNHYSFTTPRPQKFFFCPDDIERCVKGSRRRWVDWFSSTEERPPIPLVWPVKLGTKLNDNEIMKLEDAGFQLPQKERLTPTRLFNNAAPPLDLSAVDVPLNPDRPPHDSRKGKEIRRHERGPTAKHLQNVASARIIQGTILKVTMVPRPGFGCVVSFRSKPPPSESIYQLTVSSLPECTCLAFKEMIGKFGRARNAFLHCKHLYYIFIRISNLEPYVDKFMHFPTFSFNEVKRILEGGLLIHANT